MPRSKRKKGEVFDRSTLILVGFIFCVGIAVGFYFGRRSAFVSQTPAERREVSKAVSPKKEKQNFSAASLFRIPKKIGKFKLAIVIDDVGNDNHLNEILWSFSRPVTLAILPGLPYSEYYAREGKKHGFEIILHQPIEPLGKRVTQDPGMIYINMSEAEVAQVLAKNISSVSTAVGMNNHMGSRGTQDIRIMRTLFGELKWRQMFFLDSLTTSRSVGRQEAYNVGLPYLERDVFLDNELEPDYIHAQVEQLCHVAMKTGSAIGIGHYKRDTLTILKDELNRFREEGFEIVPLKELL